MELHRLPRPSPVSGVCSRCRQLGENVDPQVARPHHSDPTRPRRPLGRPQLDGAPSVRQGAIVEGRVGEPVEVDREPASLHGLPSSGHPAPVNLSPARRGHPIEPDEQIGEMCERDPGAVGLTAAIDQRSPRPVGAETPFGCSEDREQAGRP